MSWHYLQGQEVESWEGNSPDGAPSALLRLIPTPAKCLARQRDGILEPFPIWDDVRTFDGQPWRGWIDVVSGGFPASGSPLPARKKASTTRTLPSGTKWPESLARFDPPTSSLENSSSSLLRGLGQVSGTRPRSGLMRHGIVFLLRSGAPQARERLWLVANAGEGGREGLEERHGQRPNPIRWNYRDGLALAQHRARDASSRIRRVDDASGPSGGPR